MDKEAGLVDKSRDMLRSFMGRAQQSAWEGLPAAQKAKHMAKAVVGPKVSRAVGKAVALPHEALQMGQRRAREFIWKKMGPMDRAKYMLLKAVQKVTGA